MNDLNAKLENVNARISSACEKAGRDPRSVRLVAVSKLHSAGAIHQLRTAGQLSFGENYAQEAVRKQAELNDPSIEWHFIGPLQSNKTRLVAEHFQWVQSVDREVILRRLSDQRPDGLPDLSVCLQVNIDREEQKSGVLPEQVLPLARLAMNLRKIRLRGLMAIPRAEASEQETTASFLQMQQLFRQLVNEGIPLDTLSMGMSSDLEQAILAGSTMVRVGTDLFGPRN